MALRRRFNELQRAGPWWHGGAVQENPKPCLTPPWTWGCTGPSGRGWRRHGNHRTGAGCDPGRAGGGSASTGRREREREKKLTGPTNKAWSGMWGYAAPLFNKHLRNAQNLFHAFMLLFDSALQWTEPGPNHLISLVVYFSLLHLASLVCMSSCKCISMTQLTVLYWWVSLRNVTPLAKMWQVLGKPQKHAYKNHVRLGETEDNSTNGLQHLKNHNEEGFLSSVKLTFLCILF